MIGLGQTGSLDLGLLGQHPMGPNRYVKQTYGPGFPRLDRKMYYWVPLDAREMDPKYRTASKPPQSQRHRWGRSVFRWYDHIASLFIPQIGLEDVMWHVETLNNYTQTALHEVEESISLLNTEVTLMRKAILKIGWL